MFHALQFPILYFFASLILWDWYFMSESVQLTDHASCSFGYCSKKKTYLIHLNKFLMWLLTGNDFFLENQKVGWTSTSFLLLYKWPWYTRNWVYFTIFIRALCPTLHLWLGDLKSIPKLVERFSFCLRIFWGMMTISNKKHSPFF